MGKFLLICLGWLLLAQCGRDNPPALYYATVLEKKGCGPDVYYIELTKGELPVDCGLTAASSQPANICKKNAYVLNLPVYLRQVGKKIKFSKWEDRGVYCLSLSYASHHIEVDDAAEDW